jgi:hypothetical protein
MTQKLRNKVVRKLLMKRVIGGRKRQIDTVKGWFSSDEQDAVVKIIEEFLGGGEIPLYKYGGGARDNIHLSEAYGAVEYLYEHDGIDLRVETRFKEQYEAVLEAAEEDDG